MVESIGLCNGLDVGGEGEGGTKNDYEVSSMSNCVHRNVLEWDG